MNDSAYGATSGGAIAGINVVIQSVAIPAGIGAPITIPVLILAGYGLDKLIAPAFRKGAYKEVLKDISLCTDAHEAFTKFIINSYNCQMYFEDWIKKMEASHKIYKQLEGVNKAYNEELKNISSNLNSVWERNFYKAPALREAKLHEQVSSRARAWELGDTPLRVNVKKKSPNAQLKEEQTISQPAMEAIMAQCLLLNRIIVIACTPHVPKGLLDQIENGGWLVISAKNPYNKIL